MVRGPGRVGCEVAGDVEDDLGGVAGGRDVGGRELAAGPQRDRKPVGPVVTGGEVERRARGGVGRRRTEVQVAPRGLAGHREVAGHPDRVGRDQAAPGDLERSGDLRLERAGETVAAPGVQQPGRGQGVVRGPGRTEQVNEHGDRDLTGRVDGDLVARADRDGHGSARHLAVRGLRSAEPHTGRQLGWRDADLAHAGVPVIGKVVVPVARLRDIGAGAVAAATRRRDRGIEVLAVRHAVVEHRRAAVARDGVAGGHGLGHVVGGQDHDET